MKVGDNVYVIDCYYNEWILTDRYEIDLIIGVVGPKRALMFKNSTGALWKDCFLSQEEARVEIKFRNRKEKGVQDGLMYKLAPYLVILQTIAIFLLGFFFKDILAAVGGLFN